jgi:hypothetical protein
MSEYLLGFVHVLCAAACHSMCICTVIYRLMDFQHNIGRNSCRLAEFVLQNPLFNLAPYISVVL